MDQNLSARHRRTATITVRDEIFELLPERCAYRRSDRTLLAADLHWGKAETFQRHGFALPSTVIDDDLKRLSRTIHETKAERLLILGDLIHAPIGVTAGVKSTVTAWRSQHAELTLQMIRGNHDRKFHWPDAWNVEDIGTELVEGEFLFTHDEPAKAEGKFVWMGHIHPVIHLRGGGDSLRLPCFMIERQLGLLPAFSAFTGGASVGPRTAGKRAFAITDDAVIEV